MKRKEKEVGWSISEEKKSILRVASREFTRNIFPGKFIVFEGIFLSGKSVARMVFEDWLKRQKINFFSVSNDFNFYDVPVRVLEERIEKVLYEEIIPKLEKGNVVVCEKYFFSAIAYNLKRINKKILMEKYTRLMIPDLTFIFNISAEKVLKRFVVPVFIREEEIKEIIDRFLFLAEIFPGTEVVKGDKIIPETWDDLTEIFSKKFIDGLRG